MVSHGWEKISKFNSAERHWKFEVKDWTNDWLWL